MTKIGIADSAQIAPSGPIVATMFSIPKGPPLVEMKQKKLHVIHPIFFFSAGAAGRMDSRRLWWWLSLSFNASDGDDLLLRLSFLLPADKEEVIPKRV